MEGGREILERGNEDLRVLRWSEDRSVRGKEKKGDLSVGQSQISSDAQ